MAKDVEMSLREIIGEGGTLGQNTSEEDWSSEKIEVQEEKIGMDSDE